MILCDTFHSKGIHSVLDRLNDEDALLTLLCRVTLPIPSISEIDRERERERERKREGERRERERMKRKKKTFDSSASCQDEPDHKAKTWSIHKSSFDYLLFSSLSLSLSLYSFSSLYSLSFPFSLELVREKLLPHNLLSSLRKITVRHIHQLNPGSVQFWSLSLSLEFILSLSLSNSTSFSLSSLSWKPITANQFLFINCPQGRIVSTISFVDFSLLPKFLF